MKKVLHFSLFCLFLAGSICSAATWLTTAVSSSWTDPNNWEFSTEPGEGEVVFIYESNFAPEVKSGVEAVAEQIQIGSTVDFAELYVLSGGSLTLGQEGSARDPLQPGQGGSCKVVIDAGEMTTAANGGKGDIRIGFAANSDAELHVINGGTVNVGGQLFVGTGPGVTDCNSLLFIDNSIVTVDPGDTPGNVMIMGNNAGHNSSIIIRNDGELSFVDASGTLSVGHSSGTTSAIEISGSGLFESASNDLYVGRNAHTDMSIKTGGMLQLNDGTFTLAENGSATLDIDGGNINIFTGSSDFVIAENSGSSATVTMSGGTVDIIDDFKIGVDGDADFTMTGGLLVFGGSFRVGDDSGTSYLNLEGGTMVMLEESDGEFRPQDGGNGYTNITGGTFIWQVDPDNVLFQIDTIKQEASNGDLQAYDQGQRGGIVIEYLPDEPALKITAEMLDPEDYNKAYAPVPLDGENGLDADDITENPVSLSWTPGDSAKASQGHTLFFGTDEDDVSSSSTGSLKGDTTVVTLNSPTYSTATLSLGRYYWRVDENNTDNSTTKGNVWTFYMDAEYDIEDWDNYDNTVNMLSNWDAQDGAVINLITDSDGTGFDGNENMMKMEFTGASSAYANPANLELGRNDFTEFNGKVMHIQYRGVRNTGKAGLYVKLEDTGAGEVTIPFSDSDPNLSQPTWTGGWNDWYIDLTDTSITSDVDLKNIDRITLGVNPSDAGLSGVIYFGDVELDQPSCILEELGNIGDADGDCDADMDDIEMLAMYWLEGSKNIVPQAPTANPILKYTFDNTGNLGEDSAGGYDAAALGGTPVAVTGKVGSAVKFDGTYRFEIGSAGDAFAPVETSEAITIAFWVKGDPNQPVQDPDSQDLFRGFMDSEVMFKSHLPDGSGEIAWQAGADQTSGVYLPVRLTGNVDDLRYQATEKSEFEGQWNHYAFTKDFAADVQRIYQNGVLVAEDRFAEADYFTLDSFAFGGQPDGGNEYQGLVDEFTVYDVALSQENIASLAGAAQFQQPLLDDVLADTDRDGDVDFADFAKVAGLWLDGQILWP